MYREGLGRVAECRIAAGDRVQQHAALFVSQRADPLVAQRQDQRERVADPALAPHRTGDAGAGQQGAGTVGGVVEQRTRALQFDRGVGGSGVVEQVEAERQTGPALGDGVARARRGGDRRLGQRAPLGSN